MLRPHAGLFVVAAGFARFGCCCDFASSRPASSVAVRQGRSREHSVGIISAAYLSGCLLVCSWVFASSSELLAAGSSSSLCTRRGDFRGKFACSPRLDPRRGTSKCNLLSILRPRPSAFGCLPLAVAAPEPVHLLVTERNAVWTTDVVYVLTRRLEAAAKRAQQVRREIHEPGARPAGEETKWGTTTGSESNRLRLLARIVDLQHEKHPRE